MGVTSEIISADLSCTKTISQNIPVFKLLVMRHSRWLLIFAWDFINSLCVGTKLLWKRYHLKDSRIFTYVDIEKGKEKKWKETCTFDKLIFVMICNRHMADWVLNIVSAHVPILESLSISQSKFQIRLYSEELKCLRYFMSILSGTFLLLYGQESSQILCPETICIKWSDQINVTSFQKRN